LAGFVMRDFETAIRGTNLYTLPADTRHYNFVETLDELNAWEKADQTKEPGTNIIVRDLDMFKVFMKHLYKAKTPCIDTEGLNLNRVYGNGLLTIHFCFNGKDTWTIPFAHPLTPFLPKEMEHIKKKLKEYFESAPTVVTIYHTAKYDLFQFFAKLDLEYYNHKIFDISIGAFFHDENRKFMRLAGIQGGYALQTLAAEQGGIGYFYTDIAKVDRGQMAKYTIKQIAQYGALDVIYPFIIARNQIAEAKRRGKDYSGYFKAVTELGSDIVYVFCQMERSGLLVDRKYMVDTMSPASEMSQKIQESKDNFRKSKTVQQANEILLKNMKVPPTGQGIFGNGTNSWVFDPNKPKHQQVLFFDVLQLDPLERRKDGGGKTNKKFIEEYESTVSDVALLAAWRKIAVLKNTFIDGLYRQILDTADGITDWRLRANYILIQILTVRTAASKPNMQNIPSRGKLAKMIKRLFIAAANEHILVKMDFSAHEVRGWCNISKDYAIANSFGVGMILRRKLRIMRLKNPILDKEVDSWLVENGEEFEDSKLDLTHKKSMIDRQKNNPDLHAALLVMYELLAKGDPHKVNYEFFYGKSAATVTPDERQGVKQTVFGVIYEKAAAALSRDLFKKEIQAIDRKYGPKMRRLDEDSEEYQDLRRQYYTELKPYKDKAQALINLLFNKFEVGGKWIRNTQKNARETLRNPSVFGAVRHLWGYMHHEPAAQAMMDRRGPNTAIQGPSSNLGYTGAKLMFDHMWKLAKQNVHTGYRHGNAVHDSIEAESKLRMLPLTLYYLEHSMTTLAHKRARETYGFEMIIGLEIDMELGGSLAHMQKWDFSTASLLRIVKEEMQWMEKELNYTFDKKVILKCIEHNQALVAPYRARELIRQKDSYEPAETVLLTAEIASKMDWKT
jgi:DNA polymerase I-like protein with 3'-5' exonuclease and polymerase domains